MEKETVFLKLMAKKLTGTPFEKKVFAVGGFVRDQLLGLKSKDLDLVINKNGGSREFTSWLKESLGTSEPYELGKGYPIWQITFKEDIVYQGEVYPLKGLVIECADTQKESFPDETTRQRVTTFGSLEEDTERRDFTINMIKIDLTTGEIVDSAGGQEDLKNKVLRTHPKVDANKIFQDDPLRMLRLVRFYHRFNFKIPYSLLKTVKGNRKRLSIISQERINGEVDKILSKNPNNSLKLIKILKLDEEIFKNINFPVDNYSSSKESNYLRFFSNYEATEKTLNSFKIPPEIRKIVLLRQNVESSKSVAEIRSILMKAEESEIQALKEYYEKYNVLKYQSILQATIVPFSDNVDLSGEEISKKFGISPGPLMGKFKKLLQEYSNEAAAKGETPKVEEIIAKVAGFDLICQKCGRGYKLSSKGATDTLGPKCSKN